MNHFAELLDKLAFEPARNGKIRLLGHYFRTTADPDRGYALAALTGNLTFQDAKSGLVRAIIVDRVDPNLFAMSYDYVGDLSETVALLWPTPQGAVEPQAHTLNATVDYLKQGTKADLPQRLSRLLDALDPTGRWALLKLITGGLRIGVSERLAKIALATAFQHDVTEIEDIWHSCAPPYLDLFHWLDHQAPKPVGHNPTPFRSPMLAHPLAAQDKERLDPKDYAAEWKWDGIRVQAVRGLGADGQAVVQLWSRSGEDITAAFPDLITAILDLPMDAFAIDGELLIVKEGEVQPFQILQQRLNRKTPSRSLTTKLPAHLKAYDLLALGNADLRAHPFRERRTQLDVFVRSMVTDKISLSSLVAFETWGDLEAARDMSVDPTRNTSAYAVEGLMLKRWDSPYVAGRVTGAWWKWKRDPWNIDAVMLYAQRGHGKRSSLYSDFTFGVWQSNDPGAPLVPVGKAYFGFTDAELKQLDAWVRANTTNRFGPVREVVHTREAGLVLEIAFEGLNKSPRHKSGVAMRFPRISRIRWDKPTHEADHLRTLEAMLPRDRS